MTNENFSSSASGSIHRRSRPKKHVLLSLPLHMHALGTLVNSMRPLFIQAGKLESFWCRSTFEKRPILKPLFICGAPRSGSGVLLDALHQTENFATHRNKDYPFVDMPVVLNKLLSILPQKDRIPIERAGDDGLNITPDSPETLEEMLWTPFFDNLHNPRKTNVLGKDAWNIEFECYYKDNIQKMLMAQRKNRYVSKNNYLITRIKYLNKIFPDARFVVVVRHPGPQIASMLKQHKIFMAWEKNNPRMAKYIRRIKHFDLGAGRRSINLGNPEITHEISQCWKKGDDVSAYAHLWNYLYRYVHDELLDDPSLQNRLHLLRYEDLCNNAASELQHVLNMIDFDREDHKLSPIVDGIRAPNYYKSGFSDEERSRIRAITEKTSRLFYH